MTKQATLDYGFPSFDLPKLNDTIERDPYDIPVLPGSQDRGEGCGQSIPHHCNACGHSFIVESSCMLRTCPACWRRWAAKEARAAALRTWAGTQMIAPRRTGRRLVHAVISFKDRNVPLPFLRKTAIKELKKHGLSGGLVIYHPFRQVDDHFVPDGYVHFHVIGLARGHIEPGSELDDYVFKVILDARRNDYRGFQRWREISATVFYLLTHCGILKGRHALTYYGELSYNQLSNGVIEAACPGLELKPELKHRCPSCHSFDIEPDWLIDYTDYQNQYVLDNRLKAG